jgi:uncharacterized protein with NAD-binding domain and iron-sulfur cluster
MNEPKKVKVTYNLERREYVVHTQCLVVENTHCLYRCTPSNSTPGANLICLGTVVAPQVLPSPVG